ncbi:hypothetical protein QVD17_26707 [Tagetes erecta]|uniref:BHLH domain-containing protein n=1 Tax=Tagetes erecta TaxID=13708 RepID=A0AAD8K9J4_TARER|nr:hypothetical protein QVD17_26707 [Tagetes erecta]
MVEQHCFFCLRFGCLMLSCQYETTKQCHLVYDLVSNMTSIRTVYAQVGRMVLSGQCNVDIRVLIRPTSPSDFGAFCSRILGFFSLAITQLFAMEDSCFSFQCPVKSLDDHFSSMTPLFEYYEPVLEPSPRPTKQLKTHTNHHWLMNQNVIQESHRVSQGCSIVKPEEEPGVSSMGTNGLSCNNLSSSHFGNQKCYVFSNDFEGGSSGGNSNMTSTKNTTRRVAPYQDHLLAERKRREKLSQRFIALSALLPNLKKMDKASVLGDAIEYMKTLKEKVKILEEQTLKRSNVTSRRYEMEADGVEISSSDGNGSCFSEQFPEVQARFIGKDVLIRIDCDKKPGVVEKTLAEIEKLHLSVTNSTAVIFANSMLHITVTAQMDKDLTMTVKDFVRKLRFGLKQFM